MLTSQRRHRQCRRLQHRHKPHPRSDRIPKWGRSATLLSVDKGALMPPSTAPNCPNWSFIRMVWACWTASFEYRRRSAAVPVRSARASCMGMAITAPHSAPVSQTDCFNLEIGLPPDEWRARLFNGVLKFLFCVGIQLTSYPFIMQAGGGITHTLPPKPDSSFLMLGCAPGGGDWQRHVVASPNLYHSFCYGYAQDIKVA